MHSFWYRANALLTFAVTILALMCAIVSLSDNLNTPSPTAEIQVNFRLAFMPFVAFFFFPDPSLICVRIKKIQLCSRDFGLFLFLGLCFFIVGVEY